MAETMVVEIFQQLLVAREDAFVQGKMIFQDGGA